MNLPPRDLWPNAETFLKQIRDKARRGGKEIAPTPSSNASGSGHPGAGRIGGVSFSSDRPSSSGSTSTAGNPRTQLPNLLLRVPPSGEDSDDLGSDHSPKPRSPGGKKFFGTGHSTPAAGNHHHNSSGNAGFHAHEGMVKKGTAPTGLAHSTSVHGASAGASGVPPSGKGHKDRKKSAASVSATPAAGVVSAPVPSMVKPSSAKRTTSGSA